SSSVLPTVQGFLKSCVYWQDPYSVSTRRPWKRCAGNMATNLFHLSGHELHRKGASRELTTLVTSALQEATRTKALEGLQHMGVRTGSATSGRYRPNVS